MKPVVRYRILLMAIPLVCVRESILAVVIVSGGPGRCGIFWVMICRAIGEMLPTGSLMPSSLVSPSERLRALVQLLSSRLVTEYGPGLPLATWPLLLR